MLRSVLDFKSLVTVIICQAQLKVYNVIRNSLRSSGWTQTSADEDRPVFYKGNVMVECYIEDADAFPGKIEYVINAQSFPNASIFKERVGGGLG